MEKIIEYTSWIACNLGVLYFLVRLIYFGRRKSFESEVNKIITFKYFLLIKAADVNEKKENKVRILLNIMLRVFYLLFILILVLAFIFTLSQTV